MSTININIPAKLFSTDFESLKNVWQQGFEAGVAESQPTRIECAGDVSPCCEYCGRNMRGWMLHGERVPVTRMGGKVMCPACLCREKVKLLLEQFLERQLLMDKVILIVDPDKLPED